MGGKNNGLSLALCCLAEVVWRTKDPQATHAMLLQARTALPVSALTLQATGRNAIQKARKIIAGDRAKRWPKKILKSSAN
jgi:hypothetical protein